VPTALSCLLFFIAMTPIVLFVDGTLALGFACAILAFGLIVFAQMQRPGELAHLSTLVWPVAFIMILPALLMVLQTLPLPFFSRFANPIWESASTALGRSLTPSLSIDPGTTLLSLCRYLAWLGVGLLAAALTIDRQRAEWVLFAVTAATVLIAAMLLLSDAAGLSLLTEVQHAARRGGALNAAALGVVLSVACADRAYERFETRRSSDPRSGPRLVRNFLLCVMAFIICAGAVALAHSVNSLFAAAIGLVILLGVIMIRRFGFVLGGACSVALIGCVLAVAFFGEGSSQNGLDFSIRFAPKSVSSSAMAQRLLADSTWIGTGAGTYHDLVPIYRDPNESTGNEYPPTAAGQFSVEWGRPLFWAGVTLAIVMIVKLARAGLNRGRDSFYPAAGASALAVLLISAFGNPGLTGATMLILSGAVLGLALAQSRSRAVQ
jgi:hypothetical protein